MATKQKPAKKTGTGRNRVLTPREGGPAYTSGEKAPQSVYNRRRITTQGRVSKARSAQKNKAQYDSWVKEREATKAERKAGGGRSAAAKRSSIKPSVNLTPKSKALPATSAGGSGGQKPPTTRTDTAAKEPARSTGGRSGKAVRAKSKGTGGTGRTEKPVKGSHTFKRPKALTSATKTAAKAVSKTRAIGGVGGAVSAALAPAAMAAEVKATYDFKTDKSRPTVKEHAAAAKQRRAKLKEHDFSRPKGDLNKVNLGVSGIVNKAQAKVNASGNASANASANANASASKPKPAAKKGGGQTSTNTSTRKKGGYTYTGPKVGSAEYKAMRQKKYEANKAKARRNIAASRSKGTGKGTGKSATTARQQGTTAPNYQQPVMKRRVGNEHRQNTYTGDSASTSANLAKPSQTPTSGGGEEKNWWGRHGPGLAAKWNSMKGY